MLQESEKRMLGGAQRKREKRMGGKECLENVIRGWCGRVPCKREMMMARGVPEERKDAWGST